MAGLFGLNASATVTSLFGKQSRSWIRTRSGERKSSSEVSNEHGVPFMLRSTGDDVTLYPTEKYGYERKNEPNGKRNGKERLSLGFKCKSLRGKRLWSIYKADLTRLCWINNSGHSWTVVTFTSVREINIGSDSEFAMYHVKNELNNIACKTQVLWDSRRWRHKGDQTLECKNPTESPWSLSGVVLHSSERMTGSVSCLRDPSFNKHGCIKIYSPMRHPELNRILNTFTL